MVLKQLGGPRRDQNKRTGRIRQSDAPDQASLVSEVLRLQKAPKDVKELRERAHYWETSSNCLNHTVEQQKQHLKTVVEETRHARNANETRNVEEVANLRGQIEALERMAGRRSNVHGLSVYQTLAQDQLDKARAAVQDHTQQLFNLANRVTAVEEA